MNGARQQQGPGPAYGNGNGMRAPDAGGANGVYAYNQGNGSMSNGGNYGMGVNGGMASQRKMPSSSYNPNAAQGATGQGLVSGAGASGSSASGSGSARVGKVRRPRPDTEEIKRVGRIHYQELLGFLKSHLARGELWVLILSPVPQRERAYWRICSICNRQDADKLSHIPSDRTNGPSFECTREAYQAQ